MNGMIIETWTLSLSWWNKGSGEIRRKSIIETSDLPSVLWMWQDVGLDVETDAALKDMWKVCRRAPGQTWKETLRGRSKNFFMQLSVLWDLKFMPPHNTILSSNHSVGTSTDVLWFKRPGLHSGETWYTFKRNNILILELLFSSGLMLYVEVLICDGGQWQRAAISNQG